MIKHHEMTVRDIYNEIAKDSDNPSSFFFLDTVNPMLTHVKTQLDTKLLDVCTGTGFLALSAAQKYPSYYVTGLTTQ